MRKRLRKKLNKKFLNDLLYQTMKNAHAQLSDCIYPQRMSMGNQADMRIYHLRVNAPIPLYSEVPFFPEDTVKEVVDEILTNY